MEVDPNEVVFIHTLAKDVFCVPTEEILSSNSALWFSPDSGRIAFATFNDSRVDTMNFPLYGRPGDLSFQYPIQQSIKYPKVSIAPEGFV